ncbi:MBL fold metallo-hydrolase [Martelella soudanensis]|uniref:MBL fold metallo-hydrolase n=1 Tax=unclassified Martelella TaxID=2629616 RepID=UPI0015DD6373|nr:MULTISPECIES: MBL fold metallo-hydrolase [unclassified Martelella]
MTASNHPFRKGIADLGRGTYAYVQPDGSWGYSNAGLIIAGDQSVLVDTLFTLGLTKEMLDAFKDISPSAQSIDVLVNTHANGDHTFGNQLVDGARMIASKACVEEILERPPEVFRASLEDWKSNGEAGAFLHEVMGSKFDFTGVEVRPPKETFSDFLEFDIGDTRIELHEFGPAHTRGDIVVHVPSARTVFTGDLVFNQVHPILWAGPFSNWLRACDTILGWDVETVVPGHGSVSTLSAVKEMRNYLCFVMEESRQRFDAGLSYAEAAWDIALGAYDSWLDRERIVANVAQAYREMSAGAVNPARNEILALMGRHYHGHRSPCGDDGCACHATK